MPNGAASPTAPALTNGSGAAAVPAAGIGSFALAVLAASATSRQPSRSSSLSIKRQGRSQA
jgi:hypothetical protein